MPRLVALLVVLVALAAPAAAHGVVKQDLTLQMDDGVQMAASLYLPDGPAPLGGWPGVVLLHGLGGDRAGMEPIALATFVPAGYAVLAFDARAHGGSGGVVTLDGPREIADVRAFHAWFAARPEVGDSRIGAWGISYGGGAVWRSTVEGVPWAAIETFETWTDLYSALIPQGLAKSGAIAGFLNEVPARGRTPLLDSLRDNAFSGTNLDAVRAFALERSSRHLLGSVQVPAYVFQGRRDFAFGIDQGTAAFRGLRGPKRFYIGAFGHAPSTFPGPDAAQVFSESVAWFDRFLKGTPNGIDLKPRVVLAPEANRGRTTAYRDLPPTSVASFPLRGTRTIQTTGRVVRSTRAMPRAVEVFGSPVVRVRATAMGGWSRLVAVLTARTPTGKEIVVSAGGVPTRPGTRLYEIRLVSQATLVPRGSRLSVVLAGDSTKQHASNLLYLDLPTPAGARVSIGHARLSLRVLKRPISR